MATSDKRYVVQTADSVIERCLLMATDPGDVVFDPTCGGGTTALVAERWGRRWITCDTSPVAVAIARQRLTTATFDYWTLADSPEGAAAEAELSGIPASPAPVEGWGLDPARGFVYERVPTVSASSLAYDENPPPTLLVNQPRRTSGIVRVTSPFTVESESPWSHVPFDDVNGSSSEVGRLNARRTRRVRRHRDRVPQAVTDPRGARQRTRRRTSTSARSSHGPEVATSSAT